MMRVSIRPILRAKTAYIYIAIIVIFNIVILKYLGHNPTTFLNGQCVHSTPLRIAVLMT
jgi:hypothetical protein